MRRALILALCLAMVPLVAHAQSVQIIDQITQAFQTRTTGWEAALQAVALRTFMELAAVEFTWAMFRLAFQRATFDDIMAAIFNEILFIGLFLWLLESMGTIGPAIIGSMRDAAQTAAATPTITPGEIFAGGINIANFILNKMSMWHIEASAGLMIAGIVVECCYALIVACMILALIEGYFIVSAGIIFMSFGATRWTSDIAVSVLRATLSIGAKLFTVQLIASIGTQFVQQWVTQFDTLTSTNLLVVLGASIVLLVITKTVPETIQRMISGVSLAHGGALIGAGAGVAAGVAGVGLGAAALVTSVAGAGATVVGAGRLASAQMASKVAAGSAPSSRTRRAVSMVGDTIRNYGSANMTDIGRRLSGSGTSQGMSTWRQAADLNNRRRMLNEENDRPAPPSPP
jgi:type IV secretion system protein TrbL